MRGLADQLGLAPNTVARAYRDLEHEGWLEGRGRAGTFVADRLPEPPDEAEAALADAADGYLRRAGQLGFDRAAARADARPGLSRSLDCSNACSTPNSTPSSTPRSPTARVRC